MPEMWATEKGIFLKAYFKKIKLTQREIAQRLGVSQQSVNAYLNTKPFGKRAAKKWSDAFGFNFDWLMIGAGSMFPEDAENYPYSAPEHSVAAESKYIYGYAPGISNITEAEIRDLIQRLASRNTEQGIEIERNKQRIKGLEETVEKLTRQIERLHAPYAERTDD